MLPPLFFDLEFVESDRNFGLILFSLLSCLVRSCSLDVNKKPQISAVEYQRLTEELRQANRTIEVGSS